MTDPLKPEKPRSTNPANEVAKRLTVRDYVSLFALSTFRTCPLKYRLRFVDFGSVRVPDSVRLLAAFTDAAARPSVRRAQWGASEA